MVTDLGEKGLVEKVTGKEDGKVLKNANKASTVLR